MDSNIKTSPIIDEAKDVSYEFPKSEEMIIHKSDLHIQLNKFKERILATFSIFDLIAVVSLWAPIFSADFKSVFGIEPGEVQIGYIVIAFLVTVFILWSRVKYYVVNLFRKEKVSSSPVKMVENILAQCNSKVKE